MEIETQRGLETITVENGDTILQTALDQGIELTHDCKMGVCMTCPARLVSSGPILEATEEMWKLESILMSSLLFIYVSKPLAYFGALELWAGLHKVWIT